MGTMYAISAIEKFQSYFSKMKNRLNEFLNAV